MKISDIFEEVLARPELFLGIASVSRLKAFMDGYRLAAERADPSIDQKLYCGFYDWVSEKYRINTSHAWADIVLFMSGNDEKRAIDLTKELWEKYKAESKI